MVLARVLDAEVGFVRQPFVKPLLLSSGAIHALTQADARVTVEVAGRRAIGRGCIYLSDLWAWPDPSVPHEVRDAAMRRYTAALADALPRIAGTPAHPLSLGLRLHEYTAHEPGSSTNGMPPLLARAVCASPLDAAIHDAAGRAMGLSALDFYAGGASIPEADGCFGSPGAASRAIQAMLLDSPRPTSAAWWIVGHADDLDRDLAPAVHSQGYFAFKLKIKGRSASEDAARTAEVAAAARRWGLHHCRLCIDSNEANPDAQSVLAYLDELRALDADAFSRLELIEQPTARDIAGAPHDWRAVAAVKPVVVDEGLTSFDMMPLAREQGWSGFAIKTCKGHSFALVAAAWAHQHGMVVSLQDLTNPGISAIHAGLLAARLPTINGVELNSPQFTPAANAEQATRFPALFTPRRGLHALPDPRRLVGLGTGPSNHPLSEQPHE